MFPLACTVGHKSRGAVCFFLCLWFCFHILFVNASSGSTSGTLVQWSRLRIEQCEAFSAFGKSPNAISEKIISSESVRRRHFQWQALRLFHSLAKKIAINSEIHLAQKMAFTFLYEAVALYLSVRGFLIWRDFGSHLASCLPCEVCCPRAQRLCPYLLRALPGSESGPFGRDEGPPCATELTVEILPKMFSLPLSVSEATSFWSQLEGSMNALYTWIPS